MCSIPLRLDRKTRNSVRDVSSLQELRFFRETVVCSSTYRMRRDPERHTVKTGNHREDVSSSAGFIFFYKVSGSRSSTTRCGKRCLGSKEKHLDAVGYFIFTATSREKRSDVLGISQRLRFFREPVERSSTKRMRSVSFISVIN